MDNRDELIQEFVKTSDYVNMLNEWAEKCFAKAEEAIDRQEDSVSFKDGYNKGFYDAYYLAVALLTREEDKMISKKQKENQPPPIKKYNAIYNYEDDGDFKKGETYLVSKSRNENEITVYIEGTDRVWYYCPATHFEEIVSIK